MPRAFRQGMGIATMMSYLMPNLQSMVFEGSTLAALLERGFVTAVMMTIVVSLMAALDRRASRKTARTHTVSRPYAR